jgi:hypothetical protein
MTFPRSAIVGSRLEQSAIRAFQNPAIDLANAILDSMKASENIILETFQNPSMTRRSLSNEKDAVTAAKGELLRARRKTRNELRKISDGLDMEQRKSNGEVDFPSEFMNLCLFMISLLQVGHFWMYAASADHSPDGP